MFSSQPTTSFQNTSYIIGVALLVSILFCFSAYFFLCKHLRSTLWQALSLHFQPSWSYTLCFSRSLEFRCSHTGDESTVLMDDENAIALTPVPSITCPLPAIIRHEPHEIPPTPSIAPPSPPHSIFNSPVSLNTLIAASSNSEIWGSAIPPSMFYSRSIHLLITLSQRIPHSTSMAILRMSLQIDFPSTQFTD